MQRWKVERERDKLQLHSRLSMFQLQQLWRNVQQDTASGSSCEQEEPREKRFERVKIWNGVVSEAHGRGRGERLTERGWKGKNERGGQKRANGGRNHLESENTEAQEVAERGKGRGGSTLQWALVRDDQSATLSWVNKQEARSASPVPAPIIQYKHTHRQKYIQCDLELLIWKLENQRLIPTCCTLHFLLLIKTEKTPPSLSIFHASESKPVSSQTVSFPAVEEIFQIA